MSQNEASRGYKYIFHMSVLVERANYYTILAEEGRTIREVVLIEGEALAEEVWYTRYWIIQEIVFWAI